MKNKDTMSKIIHIIRNILTICLGIFCCYDEFIKGRIVLGIFFVIVTLLYIIIEILQLTKQKSIKDNKE